MKDDIISVLRIIQYTGPREWVERTISRSIKGTKDMSFGRTIKAATLGEFPDILVRAIEREEKDK